MPEDIDDNHLAIRHVDPKKRFALDRLEYRYEAEFAEAILADAEHESSRVTDQSSWK